MFNRIYRLTGYLVQDVWHELADNHKDHDIVEEDGPFQPVLVLRTEIGKMLKLADFLKIGFADFVVNNYFKRKKYIHILSIRFMFCALEKYCLEEEEKNTLVLANFQKVSC